MTLTPLTQASTVIQIHTAFAFLAVVLTLAIFSARRGSALHKTLGRIWVGAMATVAFSSFAIHEIRMIGVFSPIHLLSIFTLVQLYRAVLAARSGRIGQHQGIMKGLIFGALVLAGAFTFFPGRIMYQVLLGS